nr:heparinase II/III-family protein [Halomicroarcula sp. SHR3]
MLVDGGQPGPAHLPGHTHNDGLSVAFWADGKRLLTDTGTRGYAPTNQREYARSVAAHNTVQYGDVEPMPVGGSYLLGRRVEPSATVTRREGSSCSTGATAARPHPATPTGAVSTTTRAGGSSGTRSTPTTRRR